MRRCTSCCWPTTCRPIWPASACGPRHRRRGAIAPRVLRHCERSWGFWLLASRAASSHTRTVRSAPAETRRFPPGAKASAVTPPSWPVELRQLAGGDDVEDADRGGVAGDREGAAVVGEREVGGVADGPEGDAGLGIPENHRTRRRACRWRRRRRRWSTSSRPPRAKATARTVVPGPCADERADLLAARLPQREGAVARRPTARVWPSGEMASAEAWSGASTPTIAPAFVERATARSPCCGPRRSSPGPAPAWRPRRRRGTAGRCRRRAGCVRRRWRDPRCGANRPPARPRRWPRRRPG